jgi:hypothetical protein
MQINTKYLVLLKYENARDPLGSINITKSENNST